MREGDTKARALWRRTLRRTRVYRSRMARTLTRRTLSDPLIYMHVPKCGGTSLSEALYGLVPLDREIAVLDTPSIRRAMALKAGAKPAAFHDEGEHAAHLAAFREELLLMHLSHGAALVHGHVLFSEAADRAFGATYRYVTILRDPLARTLSNYAMARRNGIFAGDFDAFLASAMGRRMAQHALRYFGGAATVAPSEEDAIFARAKANMARFSVIGFIEAADAFADRFADAFGARPRLGHRNRAETTAVEPTRAQRARLEALCAPDIALGDYARGLF